MFVCTVRSECWERCHKGEVVVTREPERVCPRKVYSGRIVGVDQFVRLRKRWRSRGLRENAKDVLSANQILPRLSLFNSLYVTSIIAR